MILTIDIGNSNIVIGGVEGDEICFEARLRTESTKTSDQYCVDLKILLDVYGIASESIEGAIIASVVPQVLNSFQTAIKKLTGKTSLVVGPGLKTGLNILLENPSQTGADRVVGCVAALREHKPPMIIVDMGTATNMIVVNSKGIFSGVSIAPGVLLGLTALSKGTALLSQVSLEAPRAVVAKNTADCMRSGVIFGHACMVDGMIDRISEEVGENPTVYATGEYAPVIVPYCKHEMIHDEHLVLKGLNIIYKKNI